MNNKSNINELIGEEFDEMAIKFLSFAILDCNINLSNSIIEYYKDQLQESSKEILNQLLNDETKLNEIKMDIISMKDKAYFNEVYQIKNSSRVMDNHYTFQELFNVIKFLAQVFTTTNNSTPKQTKLFKDTVNTLLQHLYNLLLQSSQITFKDIQDVNDYYQKNEIEIQSPEFFKIFYYLHHKSDKLSNYFLSRTKNKFNNINYFINNNSDNNNNNNNNNSLNNYFKNHIKSYQQIKSESFQTLFLKLHKLIEENEENEENSGDIDENNEIKDNFKFNFYFDVHYLLNIKDYDTVIKLIQTMDSSKLKELNYLGFLNSINLDEPECFQLLKDFVKYDFFKNRLIVEHGIKNSRLDLIKLVLEGNQNFNRNKKIKRLSQDILISLFNISKENSTTPSSTVLFEIIEFLLSKNKDLVFNSLLNKFGLFNKAFSNGNIRVCKLIMKYAPFYVEIRIKDIKEAISNDHLDILEYFYAIGSKILKNRINTLLKKYYKNYSTLNWLIIYS